jgi:hypothetical protein
VCVCERERDERKRDKNHKFLLLIGRYAKGERREIAKDPSIS